jgi:hypothetical protein
MKKLTWLMLAFTSGAIAITACGGSGGGGGGSGGTTATSTGDATSTASSAGGATSSATSTATSSATSTATSSATTTATSSATTTATSSSTGGGCSGATPVSLTVKNYLSWCSVSVDGGAESSAGVQTVCVADGMIKVDAKAGAGFILGKTPWHDTVGDMGSGDPGVVTGMTSEALVKTPDHTCVWVCCPFPDGTGCPATDQCP